MFKRNSEEVCFPFFFRALSSLHRVFTLAIAPFVKLKHVGSIVVVCLYWETMHAWNGEPAEAEENDQIDPEEASQELFNYLVDLKLTGYLSARQTCLLAWWASKAGVGGMVKKSVHHPAHNPGIGQGISIE